MDHGRKMPPPLVWGRQPLQPHGAGAVQPKTAGLQGRPAPPALPVHRPQPRVEQSGQATPHGPVVQRQPIAQSPPLHSSVAEGVVQAKRRWTAAQHEQSRKFWEKKARKEARKEAASEAYLLRVQRTNLSQIVDADERYFSRYLKERKPTATVYRGDGRGVDQNSLTNLVLTDVNPKPGDRDISFYGVVAHTHSNASPGGMVSTTTNLQGAIEWATDDHNYGLVYEIQINDYIDVNALLAARNFRNRYQGQYEYLVPRKILRTEIKKVHLYQKTKAGVVSRIQTRSFR
jgi:hypothetical protein